MLRRFTAILLALHVLISSTGYSITAHLCHGEAVSYSLFGRPADCGTGEETALEEHCEHAEIANTPGTSCQTQACCTNESQFFKGIETAVKITGQSGEPLLYIVPGNVEPPAFVPALFAVAVELPLYDYPPPDRTRDLPVWLCVFRI